MIGPTQLLPGVGTFARIVLPSVVPLVALPSSRIPLFEKVELITFSVPWLLSMPEEPLVAPFLLLPERVELVTVSVPPLFWIPAPEPLVVAVLLLERVDLVTVAVLPLLFSMPPPKPSAFPVPPPAL